MELEVLLDESWMYKMSLPKGKINLKINGIDVYETDNK